MKHETKGSQGNYLLFVEAEVPLKTADLSVGITKY